MGVDAVSLSERLGLGGNDRTLTSSVRNNGSSADSASTFKLADTAPKGLEQRLGIAYAEPQSG